MNLDEWGIELPPEPEEFVYKKPKPKNQFDIMNSCITKKMKPTLKEKQGINEFLFHNVLSNNSGSIELALIFTTHNIPIEKQYDLVNLMMPKSYIPYPSKKKEVLNSEIECISDYYDCSIRVASEYHNIMTTEDIARIVNTFAEGKI